MPVGQKVGDAYIEVTPELDTSKIDVQMTKLAERLERKLGGAGNKAGHQFAVNFNRQVNAAVKSTGLKFDKMFASIEGSQARHHQKILGEQQAMLRTQNKQLAAQYERQLRMRKNHIDQQNRMPLPSAPTPALGGAPTPRAPGGGGGGAKRGRPEMGRIQKAFSDVISILPGQLEGLFKDPKIAAAAAVAGTLMGAAIAPALIGAAGAGVGLAGVALAAKFLASADPAFGAAASALGDRIKSALLTKLQGLAPVLMGVMQKATGVITDIIARIDLGPLSRIASMTGVAFERWGPIISDIVNSLLRIGENVMPTILSGVEGLLNTLDKVLFEAEKNKEAINAIVRGIFLMAQGALVVFGGFIQLAGAIRQAYLIAEKFLGVLIDMTNIPSPVGLLKNILGIGQTKEAADAAAPAVENLESRLAGLGAAAQAGFGAQGAAAIDAARGLLFNAGSAEDAASAQRDLNNAIDAYNAKVLEQNINAAEISNGLIEMTSAMKENGGSVKIGTKVGNDNVIALGRMLDGYYNLAKGVRDTTGDATAANAKFNELTNALKSNKGMSAAAKKAIEEMAARYRDFNGMPNIRKSVIVTPPNLAPVKAALNALKGDINIGVNVQMKGIRGRDSITRAIEKQNLPWDQRASGGLIRGPGGPTDDKIPTMLSDEEYVIKASSVRKLGVGFLDQVNAGKVPVGRAGGGSMKTRRTGIAHLASGGQVKATASSSSNKVTKSQITKLVNLNKQMAVLTNVIEKQTVVDEKYQQKIDKMRDMFNQYVNLSQIDLEGKKAGNVISDLVNKSRESKAFVGNVKKLRDRGLSSEGIGQVLEAGPGSPLAKMLLDASAADIKAINKALDDKKMADEFTANLNPMSATNRELLKATEALRKTIEKQIFILEDKGVDKKLPEQKHAGGATTFTPAQLKAINNALKNIGKPLPASGGIRVQVGGKDVNTVIRKVNAKDTKPVKRATKTRKRR